MFSEQTLSYQEPSYSSGLIRSIKTNSLVWLSSMMVFLSLIAFAVNYFYYQYPSNPYFPSGTLLAGLQLPLIYAGLYALCGSTGKLTRIAKEWCYFYMTLVLIGLATNAAQYTPFPTIDQHILKFESLFNIDTPAILAWTHAHSFMNSILDFCYNSLEYQLYLIPLVIIAIGRIDLIREYFFLLITTALIGFTFYYFFPTTAPASVINSPYFSESQHATHLKFFQLHHHIQPTTLDGGLIALPSFHVIWAWICLYSVRAWSVVFFLLLPLNLLLTAACVLLGWHYFTDILGSTVVICLAHFLYGFTKDSSAADHDA